MMASMRCREVYEYILRRPVQTMAYSISMLLLMILVGAIFTLVSLAALSVAGTVMSLVNDRLAMLSFGECSSPRRCRWQRLLRRKQH